MYTRTEVHEYTPTSGTSRLYLAAKLQLPALAIVEGFTHAHMHIYVLTADVTHHSIHFWPMQRTTPNLAIGHLPVHHFSYSRLNKY